MIRLRNFTAGLVFAAIGVATAWAQPINGEMVKRGDLDGAAKAAIAGHVAQHKSGLSGDDKAIKDSRSALLGPLSFPDVSVQFRVEYSKSLLEAIDPLVSDPRDQVAANALRLAGELATSNSLPLITRAFKDKRAPIRYAACFGAGRMFDCIKTQAAAMAAADFELLFDELAAFMARESDPYLLDGCVLALKAGASVPGDRIKDYDLRSRAVKTLADAAGAKAKELKGVAGEFRDLPVLVRAVVTVRDAVVAAGAQGQRLSQAAGVSAGGLGGDLVALCARILKGPDASNVDRAVIESLASAAEATVTFSGQLLSVTVPRQNLGSDLKASRDADFLRKVPALVGEGGVLTKAPFNLPKDRFPF